MPSFFSTPKPRHLKTGIKKTAPALLLSTALLFSACTTQNASITEATNVLQNVNVGLTDAGEVSSIDSTLISFNANNGQSSTENQKYILREAVNDLPVRITTRYTTQTSSGNNLADLEGYTGDVSINITIENLTVQPQLLTYDVAGTQKSKSSLVGAPLSVAASTTFTGIKPHKILSEATQGGGATNGIISTNKNGDTVLQWGKILAGPGNSSTATFTVNLKAEKLKVPEFTVAVHPGLTNDLTAAGAINSSFSKNQNSTMELMQQTVEVVAEANQALADAANTISKIRSNLNSSADSLKTSTIQELEQSSKKLTGQLSDLQEKLANLRTNLDESTQGSQDELINQMKQTLESLENFLGKQGEEIPAPVFDAQTCHISIAQPENGSTVYSNMVQLSNALGAYSQANVDCRDQVLSVVNTMLGPENPTAENCQGEAAASASCSVYNSKAVLDANLVRYFVETSQQLQDLLPGSLAQIRSNYETAQAALTDLQARIDALPSTGDQASQDPSQPSSSPEPSPSASSNPANPEDLVDQLQEIDQQLQASDKDLDTLDSLLKDIHTSSQEALAELKTTRSDSGSMLEQSQDLADQLCALAENQQLPLEEANKLRSYLTDTPCQLTSASASPEPTPTAQASASSSPSASADPTASASPSADPTASASPSPLASASSLTPPTGYQEPLEARLQKQIDLWNSIKEATDTSSDSTQAGKTMSNLRKAHQEVKDQVSALLAELKQAPAPTNPPTETAEPTDQATAPVHTDPNENSSAQVQAAKDALPQLLASFETLNADLDELAAQQEDLTQALQKIFGEIPAQNADEISQLLSAQTRRIDSQRSESKQAITDLFNQQVTNLTGTSSTLNTRAETLLQEQGNRLNDAAQWQAEQADARTRSALERIQESHQAATQDVAAASTILTGELENIMLDIGDTSLTGSGLLGSLENNASTAGNADYQLSLATQNAEKYAVIREEDMGAIRLKQAQYTASLRKISDLPAFKMSDQSGATVKTIYTFTIGSED